ncbi:hypothetical protein ACF08E_11040 [Streptomyces globisporus]|uniref:hypothetical protein n=1 Tax=Streptomyces globisporus TaxID=1908 RepID=UPI003701C583
MKKILRDREEHELASLEDLQRRATRWTAQHQEESARVRRANAELSRLQHELAALEQKASTAEEARRAARTAADERERTARLLEAAAAEARGRLAGLREAATDPSLCPQCVRPLDLTGLSQDDCPVCRRFDPERQQRTHQFQRRMAEAQQGAERAREAARRAAQAAEDARGRAGTEAWASARAFAQDVIAPQQQIVVEAEASVRELAARLEQNTEHLRELTELTELREQLPKLQELKEAAEAAYTAARNDTDLMVKQGTDRWSNHLLRRMQACDPEITTASVSPEDFSVTVNGGAFDSTVVTGHGRTRINVSTLLALRDTAREVPAMPVPQFLMVDSPFTGLGNSPKDQRTGAALLEGLTELATSQHPSHRRASHHRLHRTARPSPGSSTRDPHQPGRRRHPRPAPARLRHTVENPAPKARPSHGSGKNQTDLSGSKLLTIKLLHMRFEQQSTRPTFTGTGRPALPSRAKSSKISKEEI